MVNETIILSRGILSSNDVHDFDHDQSKRRVIGFGLMFKKTVSLK